jgi:hypothetical protein
MFETYQGAAINESPPRERDHRYVHLEECKALWVANRSVDHPDVSLPHGWHLNRARVPVSPAPPVGPRLDVEIRCHIRNLPQSLREDHKYRNKRFWCDFLNWEHTVHRRTTRHEDLQSWEAHPFAEFLPDEEDEDDENYHVVKEEAMEDVPPGAGYLPPEYQALMAGGYDEGAFLM